jgi:hypothetical protein
MAEVLVQFDRPVRDAGGRTYVVRVLGRPAADGLWEGWIEFEPRDGEATLRTPRETEQPDRADLQYWASCLTMAYLEGAFERARRAEGAASRPPAVRPPASGPPAANTAGPTGTTPHWARPRAVLDPFEVYAQGEDVLRKELRALDEGHLRNIIRAYGLGQDEGLDQSAVDRRALAEMIVAAVRKRVG